jgi:DNA-binding ferritin-like protein (Dps family)
MSDDPGIDPGANPGSQPEPGNQPLTINAELLGEFKDDPVFKPFEGKGLGDVFKSYKHAQTLVGAEKIPIPAGKLNTPENWNYVMDKLGRPKSADGYKLEANLPEGFPKDEKLTAGFKQVAHYLGLLPWQAEGLYKFYNDAQVEAFKEIEAQMSSQAEKTEAALMAELGTKQKYDEFVRGADAALQRFGGSPEDIAAFSEKFGNDPIAVKILGNVAKAMMEDAAIRGDKNFDLFGEDAAAKVKNIMEDKANPLYEAYWSASHPQHQHAVDEVARLMAAIHGDKKVQV